jgi:hypothetical protein
MEVFMQVLLVAALAVASLGVTSPAELEWSNHYADAKKQAAAEQRPLLVVLEDASNPAGRFDQDNLASQEKQLEMLQNYRLCRMDVNTAYGKRVAEAFGANQFPFTAITDKSAQFVKFRTAGAMTPQQWEQTLSTQQSDATVQRVDASKIITQWPMSQGQSSGSYCPSCVRNQYYQ